VFLITTSHSTHHFAKV